MILVFMEKGVSTILFETSHIKLASITTKYTYMNVSYQVCFELLKVYQNALRTHLKKALFQPILEVLREALNSFSFVTIMRGVLKI